MFHLKVLADYLNGRDTPGGTVIYSAGADQSTGFQKNDLLEATDRQNLNGADWYGITRQTRNSVDLQLPAQVVWASAGTTYGYMQLTDALPSGYVIKKVRAWDDKTMQSYGYDVSRGGWNAGQFQVVTCYVVGHSQDNPNVEKWVGTWSAVSNYNRLNHTQIMMLANMQLLEHGYQFGMSDTELIAIKDKKLPDGYTLTQKFNWLYNGRTDAVCVMWMRDGGNWWTTKEMRYGTMVNGGQLVAVSEASRIFRVTMPNRSQASNETMRQILTFTNNDFGKSHATHPWLAQWATVANKGNVYGEYQRGHIACPVALNPSDFDFGGTFVPTSYWLPEVWLQDV